MALRRILSRSFCRQCFSGLEARSANSQWRSIASEWPEPSVEISEELRLFRRIISAELIAMLVNQDENLDLLSEAFM
jgi:hypothetical protein